MGVVVALRAARTRASHEKQHSRPTTSASASRSKPALPAPSSSADAVAFETADGDNDEPLPATLEEQRARILERMKRELGVGDAQIALLRAIFNASEWLGQGNPKARRPAMTQAECRSIRRKAHLHAGSAVCGSANMVAVYDPSLGQTERDAAVCIDQYEFPNIPCEYPVVWVRASEASAICKTLGKRLCDAHEWEGACAGRLLPPEKDYPWDQMPRAYIGELRTKRRLLMEYLHNESRDIVWAYGPTKDHQKCGTQARKDPRCTIVDWGICGTNDYPAGAFPECVSPFGVYDQHGNVAEHMSLPLYPEELGSRGGVGWTEMKGSWFLFAREETHPDDCRWRARNWHTTRTDHWNSHRNYHLGFRCCKDVAPSK